MSETNDDIRGRDDLLDRLAADVRAAVPPEDLQGVADAAVTRRLAREPAAGRRGRRPSGSAWAALAAAAALVVILVAMPRRGDVVFADMVNALRASGGVTATGWIRGADGGREPCRLVVDAAGRVHMETGPDSARTIVDVTADRRLVRTPDGAWLSRAEDPRRHRDLDQTLRKLFAGYEDPQTRDRQWESAKEDLGDIVRFTWRDAAALGRRPGRLRHVLDVDRATRLPVRGEVHQLRDGRWWQVSELRYADYGVAVPPTVFAPEAGARPVPMTPAQAATRWFALGVGPESLLVPAVIPPRDGLAVRWLSGDEPGFDGITGGASTVAHAGVTTWTFVAMPLHQALVAVSGLPVVDNAAAAGRVSVEIRAETALPWRTRVAALLDSAGVTAAEVAVVDTCVRLVFTQDGRPVPSSTARFVRQEVNAGPDGYRYTFARLPLRRVVEAMLGNSRHDGILAGPHTVEFAAADSAAFATPVDLEFANPSSSWEENLRRLGEDFGVRWTAGEIRRERTMIELTPRK